MGKLFVTFLVMASLALAGASAAAAESYYTNYRNGVKYMKKRQYDKAALEFTKALQANPRFANAYTLRGVAYAAGGRFDQAMADSNKAVELNPRSAMAYETRAIGYYAQKRYDKAWDDVRKAKSLGYKVDSKFLQKLRQASGRQN